MGQESKKPSPPIVTSATLREANSGNLRQSLRVENHSFGHNPASSQDVNHRSYINSRLNAHATSVKWELMYRSSASKEVNSESGIRISIAVGETPLAIKSGICDRDRSNFDAAHRSSSNQEHGGFL